MARSRNIKPSFFVSEQIADQDPLGRLLFIGLWTLADYKGDLEWKERTIKVQVLPFDDCSVKELAINLDKSGLIRFYSDGDRTYINIPNFNKHQNPHKNEKAKGSEIPPITDSMRQAIDLTTLAINLDKSRSEPECSASDPADSLNLIPDSPIPDSGFLIPSPNSDELVSDDASRSPPPAKRGSKKSKPSEAKGAATWNAYTEAYFRRYGVEPVRNVKVSSQIAQLVDRLGAEDAPHVAAFFVCHNSSFYVAKGHAVGLLLADAEKLRTEWATGRSVTQTQARQTDKTATNPFLKMLGEST